MNIKISNKRGPKQLKPYDDETENCMRIVYSNLSEKDRRQYSAVESLKLSFGGNRYICNLFSCSPNTLSRGMKEILSAELLVENRERKIGGGRKSLIESVENINDIFLDVVDDFIAGSPMDENIKWLNLSNKVIANKMGLKGVKISVTVVKQLLKRNNFVKRKASKNLAIGISENRNEQFENIAIIKEDYMNSENNPIISMDTKKKSC